MVVYEFFFGPVPEGFECDHLCRKRNCINPFHIEVVTHKVNMERAVGPGKYERVLLDACSKGHALTVENTYPSNRRCCRICHWASVKEYRRKKKLTN